MYNSFTPEELDFLDFLYDYDFFDIRIDRNGNVKNVYYDKDEILEKYFDEEQVAHIDFDCVDRFAELLKTIKFYDGYIELNDEHTLWKINTENITEDEYANLVDSYAGYFKYDTGCDLYFLGRSGRHVCVDDTFDNIVNYDFLRNTQMNLEQDMIDEINNMQS